MRADREDAKADGEPAALEANETCEPRGGRRSRREVIAGLVIAGGAAMAGTIGWIETSKGAGTPTAGAASPVAASPAASSVAGNQVIISNFAFSPAGLTIPAGSDVVWLNQDDIPHTVTSADKTSFASALLDTGDQFHHRFAAAGTFPYFCALHPFMTGKIIVQ